MKILLVGENNMKSNVLALLSLALSLGFTPMPRARLEFPEIQKGKSTTVDRLNPLAVSAIQKADARRESRNRKRLQNRTIAQ